MKNITKLLTVIILALAMLGQASTVQAAVGQVFNVKGLGAFASFSDISGCVVTDVFVIASENLVQAPRDRTAFSSASVVLTQYDACTGIPLISAYGVADPLPQGGLTVSKQLTSAVLNTTMTMYDGISGNTFDVAVNLQWTGSGALTRQHNNLHFNAPGCKTRSRFNGSFQDASVIGTITDGDNNFIPQASVSASINSVKSGTVMIGCN